MSDSHALDPGRQQILAAAAGDAEAFAEIYRRYQHVVYRFGCAMTGSESAAEDITQETFVALFQELRRYDPERASFTTYLYGIVRNLSRERVRRERRFLSLDVLRADSRETVDRNTPNRNLEDAQLSAQIKQALRKLPPHYRELIILCDLHGVSYAEAGAITRVSTAAVRSRLHRGRQLLRRNFSRIAGADFRSAFDTERCAI